MSFGSMLKRSFFCCDVIRRFRGFFMERFPCGDALPEDRHTLARKSVITLTCTYSRNLKKRFPFRVADPFEAAFWVKFAFPMSAKRNSQKPEFALAKIVELFFRLSRCLVFPNVTIGRLSWLGVGGASCQACGLDRRGEDPGGDENRTAPQMDSVQCGRYSASTT